MIYICLALLIINGIIIFLFIKNQKQYRKKLNDFELIYNLNSDISNIMELKLLLPKIMEVFVKAGNVSKASIMLLNHNTGELEIRYGIGISESAYEKVRPKLGEGVAGICASTAKPVLIATSEDKNFYKDFFDPQKKLRPKETLLCLPLIAKGKVLGVINLDAKSDGSKFHKYDEKLLSILSTQSAIAISNAQLYESAITDTLTGLYTRRHFLGRLKQEMERSMRYNISIGLIVIDIDNFKLINDTYGHQTGDFVLVHLAGTFKNFLRITDFSGRLGGEEFAILLLEVDLTDALKIAERIRKKVESTPLNIGDKYLNYTISCGVSIFTGFEKLNFDEFLHRADSALYKAKQDGRNRTVSW